ncbi:superoxide dismutase family protein [Paracoccus sediminis]|uniref:Superoxide dismutase family protein n=1 Tax=Paracoccus sediminis TaxID=1214787 RepID=A0A238XC75_9RHOB|nr:superoxide dismutase family protein [Paracoccus sediminis]TBN49607.1 superoxide dismutase family protein [Paracoccus sediminis]SNR56202.1 superoxide dismutase, Cu-Zn family [Paracoccus sediminis]
MPFRSAAALGLLLALPAAAQDTASPAAPTEGEKPMIAEIKTAEGESRGTATIVATPSGMMLLTLELQDVPPGIHGAHVHQTGECSPPDFESAGGHLAGEKEHGLMSANGPHPGDLPNIHVPESGSLMVEAFVSGLTAEMLADDDGSAFIIHEQPDDYVGQPSGHAGNRIGCGTFAQAG